MFLLDSGPSTITRVSLCTKELLSMENVWDLEGVFKVTA